MPALRIDRSDSAKGSMARRFASKSSTIGSLLVCGPRAALARLPPERSTAHSVRPVRGAFVLFSSAHRPG